MKKIIITFFILCYLAINSFGQVSIGSVLKPDSNVILDLTNFGNKGLLLPKTNTGPKKPLGNIFYDNSKNMIGVVVDTSVSNNGINYLSPWSHTDRNLDVTYSDTGKIIINYTGSKTDKVILEVNDGDLEVNNGDVNVADGKIKEYGKQLLPRGAIIMWSGNTPPDGWALCDGGSYPKEDVSGNVTVPNLKGRFIVGYDPSNADYNAIGNLGGSKIMSHTHGVNPPNRTTTGDGAHTHTGTTDNGGGAKSMTRTCCQRHNVAETNHTHTFTTNSNGNHTHNLDIPNFTSAAASNIENRPPYYTLAYIYKL